MPAVINCDPAALARAAACYCLPVPQYRAAVVWLLAQIAGDTSTPAELARKSACYCFDHRTAEAVATYQLAQLSGDTSTPAELAAAAKCFCVNEAQARAITLYLLQQIQGSNLRPEQLARFSACFCFDQRTADSVITYLLCAIANAGGSTPCTMPSKATTPSPVSGTEGLSTASPVLSWVNGGGATSYDVWFNGTFMGNQAGLSFTPGVLAYGSSYAWRVDAVNACGTTTGDVWILSTIIAHPTAYDWATRVVTNGGAAPSVPTVSAMSDFCYALDASSLSSEMFAVVCFVPDNLIAAITPLYKVYGNDPWTNEGPFVSGDLSVNGLKSDGSTKYLKTGCIPIVMWPSTGVEGVAIYCATDDTGNSYDFLADDGAGKSAGLYVNYAGTDYLDSWNETSGQFAGVLPGGFHGFHCGVRVDSANLDIYIANSSTPCASIVHGSTMASAPPAVDFYCFAQNRGGAIYGNPSARRFSFVAVHNSLNLAQVTNLYNAVQALRTALGGGAV